jgi:hypothetical protein
MRGGVIAHTIDPVVEMESQFTSRLCPIQRYYIQLFGFSGSPSSNRMTWRSTLCPSGALDALEYEASLDGFVDV